MSILEGGASLLCEARLVYTSFMHIREAAAADVKELSSLATRTWLDAFGHRFSEAEQRDRIEKHRSEEYFHAALARDHVLVAEEGSTLIGYVEFGPPDLPIPTEEDDKEVTRLYVLASHQRQGIGKKLLDAALAYSGMQAAKSIYLDVWEKNEGAIRLYESYGFKNTGHVVDEDLIMVRKNNR